MREMQDLISRLAETEEATGDYTGEDGLLYCGKCHTPKQTRMPHPFSGEEELLKISCKCQQEESEAAAQQTAQKRFEERMDDYRRDGISCPNGLRFTFAQDDRVEPKVSDACRRYVEDWEKMLDKNIGILFYGTVGTGKSFYASCIGNGLLAKRVSVAATNFPRLLNLLQATQEKQKLLDHLAVYKLLILDDLGVERDSPYAAEQIFNVIDTRLNSGLPVIVTTNLTLEELEHPASMQYKRIYDRVLEMCPTPIMMVGESRRRGNAEARKRFAQRILLG